MKSMGHRGKLPFAPFHWHLAWFVFLLCSLALPLSRLNADQFYNDWAATNLTAFGAASGPTDDPDYDGAANLAEYAFGTDPLVSQGVGGAILPLVTGTDGVFQVVLFEQAGHRPGVQIDLDATATLTNWIRPWWVRSNSLPADPTSPVTNWWTTYLPATNIFIVRGSIHLILAGPETADYYVAATNGNDTYPGTITQPFATLGQAVNVATNAGNLVYMRGGRYAVASRVNLTKSGNAAQPIRIRAYPGETPTLDGSSFSSDVISISGSYYQLYGLVITNAGHNSVAISGSNNTVERCVSYGARNTGFNISGGANTANNLFLNCDSTRSYDPPKYGSDADGFGAKDSLGANNVFRGCRSWENSDDGWDFWMATSPVLIDTCWTWGNGNASNFPNSGSFAGNGNGFKLGGNFVPAAHHLVNCLSFNNHQHGIDQNNNTAGLTVDQNTSWANGKRNFNLWHGDVTAGVHVVHNNLSIGGGNSNSIAPGSVVLSNSWQVLSSDAVTNDFVSLDTSWATAPRRDDGSLPETPFLRPTPGGRLVDQGTNIGAAFFGSAPDLGAFETPVW